MTGRRIYGMFANSSKCNSIRSKLGSKKYKKYSSFEILSKLLLKHKRGNIFDSKPLKAARARKLHKKLYPDGTHECGDGLKGKIIVINRAGRSKLKFCAFCGTELN